MNKITKFITTDSEQREIEAAGKYPKLEYVKDSKQVMAWALKHGIDCRMWNMKSNFIDSNGCSRKDSTFTIQGLRELGVIK